MSVLFDHDTRQINRSAEISDCGRYRWWLRRSWRLWDEQGQPRKSKGVCCFVMLNPSTADGTQDDPTIRRCIGFAKAWGYDTLSVRNLFPWRATDPRELFYADTVTGGDRGDSELLAACTADLVVLAWGADVPFNRDGQALELFTRWFPARSLHCLALTKHGNPRHPLYVNGDATPILFRKTTEIVYRWLDGREEVRYRRPYASPEAAKLIEEMVTANKADGVYGPRYFVRHV